MVISIPGFLIRRMSALRKIQGQVWSLAVQVLVSAGLRYSDVQMVLQGILLTFKFEWVLFIGKKMVIHCLVFLCINMTSGIRKVLIVGSDTICLFTPASSFRL